MATAEQLAKLAGRHIVASVSGGKDSAALALHLRELDLAFTPVFMDTGWEADATYEYLRGPLTDCLGPIVELKAERQMLALIRHKGMFSSKQRRYCTRSLKVEPMQAYLRTLDYDHVNAVGIRAEESAARASMSEWEWSDGFDCDVWRPILTWTFDDVVAIHKRHNLAPNPLYLQGAERVGCWPCVMSRKAEVRMIADLDPARIDLIRDLEAEVKVIADARYAERGESLASLGYDDPAWFQAAIGRKGMWPIDRVVEWSRTKRGGKEPELFAADPADAGCMRWGMCDTPASSDEP